MITKIENRQEDRRFSPCLSVSGVSLCADVDQLPKLFQSCLKVVSKLSQSYLKVAPKLSQSCHKFVPKLSQICPKVVPKLSQSCPNVVLKLSQSCTMVDNPTLFVFQSGVSVCAGVDQLLSNQPIVCK